MAKILEHSESGAISDKYDISRWQGWTWKFEYEGLDEDERGAIRYARDSVSLTCVKHCKGCVTATMFLDVRKVDVV